MSQELLASKVAVVEEEPKVRGIASAPTSVAGAVGLTERGPYGTAVLCTSFDEYQTTFGGFTADSDLPLAVMGFFENGGSDIWVSRVASAYASTASVELSAPDPGPTFPAVLTGTLAAPFSMGNSQYLGIRVFINDSYSEDWSLTFSGSQATVTSTTAPNYTLSNGMTLLVSVNGGPSQTLTFEVDGGVSVGTLVNLINSQLTSAFAFDNGTTFSIRSLVKGYTSAVTITGGDAAAALGLLGASATDTGNLPNFASVTVADIAAAVEAAGPSPFDFVSNGDVLEIRSHETGHQVSFITTGDGYIRDAWGIDAVRHYGVGGGVVPVMRIDTIGPGDYGNRLSVDVLAPTSADANEFDLVVRVDGVERERFKNLSRVVDHVRYVEMVINDSPQRSSLIRAVNYPDTYGEPPTLGSFTLVGGFDASGDLNDADFIGDENARTGLRAFDAVQGLSILLVPGRATPAVHNAMLTYCAETRDGSTFAVLDPPAGLSAAAMVTYTTTTASLENTSEYGAIYWPRVKVLNPDKSVFGDDAQVVVPPSGIIAGVYARTDGARPGGVYDSPAGTGLGKTLGVLGYETQEALEERKRDLVYPHRINPLTTESGLPRYIDGSRTLKGDGNFPSIGARRGVTFIEQSLKQGLAFARHKNNTPELRAQVRRTITAFLTTQMNNGAFSSREPSKAFFVDVSEQLNTPTVIAAGKLLVRVGLATNSPAEFVVLQISQDTRAIEADLAGG